MKETGNTFTKQGLLNTIQHNCTPETKKLMMSEWDAIYKEHGSNSNVCKKARIEWAMECWFTFNQPGALMIVRNLKTKTYQLVETDDELVETENSLDYADWTGRV